MSCSSSACSCSSFCGQWWRGARQGASAVAPTGGAAASWARPQSTRLLSRSRSLAEASAALPGPALPFGSPPSTRRPPAAARPRSASPAASAPRSAPPCAPPRPAVPPPPPPWQPWHAGARSAGQGVGVGNRARRNVGPRRQSAGAASHSRPRNRGIMHDARSMQSAAAAKRRTRCLSISRFCSSILCRKCSRACVADGGTGQERSRLACQPHALADAQTRLQVAGGGQLAPAHTRVGGGARWSVLTCRRGSTLTCSDSCSSASWRSTSWMRLILRAMLLRPGSGAGSGQRRVDAAAARGCSSSQQRARPRWWPVLGHRTPCHRRPQSALADSALLLLQHRLVLADGRTAACRRAAVVRLAAIGLQPARGNSGRSRRDVSRQRRRRAAAAVWCAVAIARAGAPPAHAWQAAQHVGGPQAPPVTRASAAHPWGAAPCGRSAACSAMAMNTATGRLQASDRKAGGSGMGPCRPCCA